jgi:hypothetical protein
VGKGLPRSAPIFTVPFAFQSPDRVLPQIAPIAAVFGLRTSDCTDQSEPLRFWRYSGSGTLEVGKRERGLINDRTLCVPGSAGSDEHGEVGRQEGGPEEDHPEKS